VAAYLYSNYPISQCPAETSGPRNQRQDSRYHIRCRWPYYPSYPISQCPATTSKARNHCRDSRYHIRCRLPFDLCQRLGKLSRAQAGKVWLAATARYHAN